jgi:large subunit ribosomal protein L14
VIYFHTNLKISDNSGGIIGKCIKIITSAKKKANVGELILVVIKKFLPTARVKKKKIYIGLIIRTKQSINRFDSTKIKFNENNIILLNKDKELLFSKIRGPIPRELRKSQKYGKIISRSYKLV